MEIVSPFFTFPVISWWAAVQRADTVIFDPDEHFQKMTCRNRYRIDGSNNPILLSVPLMNGRNQRISMGDVQIHNGARWQTQHWRSLVSVYNRAPFFEHYRRGLQSLYETRFTHLIDFNRESILWAKRQLKMDFEIREAKEYIKEYPPLIRDLRHTEIEMLNFPQYYQVFADRVGFQPDLSILDLLFSEGPGAAAFLKQM